MTLLRSISLIVAYLSVCGGGALTVLKLLDVISPGGIKLLGITIPFTGLLFSSTSIITLILVILFVCFSIALVIGVRWNVNLFIISYLIYTLAFLVYYASIYFLRHFWVSLSMAETLRYVIPIGCMTFFLLVISMYYCSSRAAKDKQN